MCLPRSGSTLFSPVLAKTERCCALLRSDAAVPRRQNLRSSSAVLLEHRRWRETLDPLSPSGAATHRVGHFSNASFRRFVSRRKKCIETDSEVEELSLTSSLAWQPCAVSVRRAKQRRTNGGLRKGSHFFYICFLLLPIMGDFAMCIDW